MTKSNSPSPSKLKNAEFGPEISLFTKHLEAIGDVLVGTVMAIQRVTKDSHEKLFKFEEERCDVELDGKNRRVKVPNTQYRQWKRLSRSYEHFELARMLMPRSLLVSLVSQYDAYLGRLLRVVFLQKPDILNGSDKKLSFESLNSFSSIDEAKEYILEKEIESILRSSHSEQFRWMEKTFEIPLKKGLESWPRFMEITERRNLFVHTDGVVSSQYISVCSQNKCILEENITEGKILNVPQEYFEEAHATIYEIGVKLGHVLWRKLLPEDRENADTHLTNLSFDLIDRGKYALAIRILDFACEEIKKFSNELHQLTFIVNRAQAYKWNGDHNRCSQIMKSVDWTAKGDQFRLADAVLSENWEFAAQVMRRIGRSDSVDQTAYRDWPLFSDWRKQDDFLKAYAEIFGEEFSRGTEVKQLAAPQSPEALDETLDEEVNQGDAL
jgi:hypothetical protein